MAHAGLSLVGFMDEAGAVEHLRKACVPAPTADDAALRADWQAARAKLGAPVPNAGHPNLQSIPPANMGYINALLQLPWVAAANQGPAAVTQANFQLVEIDPLLAFQFSVDLVRSDNHCNAVAHPPTMQQLLAICFPTAPPNEGYGWQRLGQSAMIKAKTLNLRVYDQGIINGQVLGLIFGPALQFTQVTRFNNRLYLFNGFHRAIGLRRAGATHMPCVVRDVATVVEAGVKGGKETLPEALMVSADPPTLAHLTRGSAFDVQIREVSRILHVSWAEYLWPEE